MQQRSTTRITQKIDWLCDVRLSATFITKSTGQRPPFIIIIVRHYLPIPSHTTTRPTSPTITHRRQKTREQPAGHIFRSIGVQDVHLHVQPTRPTEWHEHLYDLERITCTMLPGHTYTEYRNIGRLRLARRCHRSDRSDLHLQTWRFM